METSPPNIAWWHWHKVGAGVHLCCVDVPLLYERTGPRNLHRHVSYARRCFGLQSHEQLVCHLFHGVRCGAAAGATVEVSEHSRDNGVCAPSSRMVEVRELLHGSVCVLSGICRAAIGSGLGHSERTQCIAYGWCGVWDGR